MSRYLLDTNAVIALLNDPKSPLGKRLRRRKPEEFCISAIVAHELFYGAFKSRHATANIALVDALRFEVLELDREDARSAGQIRAQLSALGTQIGPYDVLIAGQARARGLILITHNTREFSRVPDLQCEDWAK